MTGQQAAKLKAAHAALASVKNHMVVGLGSGSTASLFIEALGEAMARGEIKGVRGVPTSRQSEILAREAGIPIVGFDKHPSCDLTIDGADEVSPELNLIKGLGGALLREKMVAQNSRRLLIVADESKRVTHLGEKSPLPVEVTTFGHDASARFLRELGCEPVLRTAGAGVPYLTDNGNHIYDCRFDRIEDAKSLAMKLADRAGIVEHGLFIGVASEVLIASETGEIQRLVR